jgi:hypothetical protein
MRSWFWIAVLVGCAALVGVATCGPDDAPTGGEVHDYLDSLRDWEEFSPPQEDDSSVSEVRTFDSFTGQNDETYGCISRQASLTNTPDDVVIYSPDSEILYLGSLLTGQGYVGGIGTLDELPIRQRAPLTISIDLLAENNTRVVENPDLSTVKQAIGGLIEEATNTGLVAGANISSTIRESHSVEQGALSIGLSARYMNASVKANLETSRSDEQTSLQIRFLHRMFTVSMVLPQTPGELFSDQFTQARLDEQVAAGRIGPDNVPVYVSSIVYGRMLVATMTSSSSQKEMEAALKASYDAVIAGGEATLTQAQRDLLEESEIKIVAIGGSAAAVEQMLRTGNLKDYFNIEAPLTTAVPLSYTMRSVSDNAIAAVSETTSYELKECLDTVYFTDEVEWNNAVEKLSATIYKLDTTRERMAQCEEISTVMPNAPVGLTMTWMPTNTEIPTEFVLRAFQGTGLVCEDQEFDVGGRENWISIGDVDNYSNDDFEVEVNPPPDVAVFAIAITVGDNVAESSEKLEVYDENDILRATIDSNLPERPQAFVGIVSGIPLSRIFLDESSSGGDDIAVRDLRFGVIEDLRRE